MTKSTEAENAYKKELAQVVGNQELTEEEKKEAAIAAVVNLITFGVKIGDVKVVDSVPATGASEGDDD